ncbi:MAG: DUF3303 family protein [Rhodospirillaceae bacterium]
MLYMVVEQFKDDNAQAVYERYFDKGRMMPEGMTYISSWVTIDLTRCYQIVECEDEAQLQTWMDNWTDLVDFFIRPVVPGADMMRAFQS